MFLIVFGKLIVKLWFFSLIFCSNRRTFIFLILRGDLLICVQFVPRLSSHLLLYIPLVAIMNEKEILNEQVLLWSWAWMILNLSGTTVVAAITTCSTITIPLMCVFQPLFLLIQFAAVCHLLWLSHASYRFIFYLNLQNTRWLYIHPVSAYACSALIIHSWVLCAIYLPYWRIGLAVFYSTVCVM